MLPMTMYGPCGWNGPPSRFTPRPLTPLGMVRVERWGGEVGESGGGDDTDFPSGDFRLWGCGREERRTKMKNE